MAWSYVVTTSYQTHYSFADNATEVYTSLLANGFTHEAAIGVLSNMEHESAINPGQMEHGYGGDPERGYGLVQWTPASTKILAYASSIGAEWYDGNVQMQYFYINVPASWIKKSSYPYSYEQYKQLTDIYVATQTFFSNFERGTYTSAMNTYAEYWNEYFGGVTPPVPPKPYEDDDIIIPLTYLTNLWH